MSETLASYASWIFFTISFGLVTAYFVHWLLVRTDFRDYRREGGSLDMLRFRRLREHVKHDYRHQRELSALHLPHKQVPSSLGEYVNSREDDFDSGDYR